MADKKKKESKAEKARKKKVAIAEDKKPVARKSLKDNTREEFRVYFLKLSKKLKLKKYMEEVLWSHLKATGNDKKELFEKGIKHFGYKI